MLFRIMNVWFVSKDDEYEFILYILRFPHEKSPLKIPTEYTTNPIRKAYECENTSFVQSETRTIVLPREGLLAHDFLFKQNGRRSAKICFP